MRRSPLSIFITRAVTSWPTLRTFLILSTRSALVCLVHFEDDGFDFVALLQNFGRMIDLPCPRDIGNVDHAIETFLEFDEGAVAGEVANLAFDACPRRIFLLGAI